MSRTFDHLFLIQNLVAKDFKVRYRNMSLGVFWSVLNPLVMMGVLTFVFTKVFPSPTHHSYPLFALCGLVPYSFFNVAWINGTSSLAENASLIKHVAVPREWVPLSAVLSNSIHLGIQMTLLLGLMLIFGPPPTIAWLWLPAVWLLEIVFVCGLALATSALNVYVRDMRYVVESFVTVLFWMVPILYDFSMIPQRFAGFYELNPMAAIIMALRNILIEGQSPAWPLLAKLTGVSLAALLLGIFFFERLKRRFYDYL